MIAYGHVRSVVAVLLILALSACTGGGLFGNNSDSNPAPAANSEEDRETLWDLFDDQNDPNTTVQVNRYIWNASLEVLDFLPLQAVDPFSGVIITGWGKAPGGGKEFKATVYVKDPALDARSLRVSLLTRSGPADTDTVRQVEDAILTKARQLRIADMDL